MHCELAGGQKGNAGPARFEVTDKCQGAPLKEAPRVTRPSAGRALPNPQMSFKIAVSGGGEHPEPQQSPPEMSAPLLDFLPKRPSIFERIPVLPRPQELRCAKGSKDYFQQQKHQSVKGEFTNA
ncbi:zinc finger protein glis1 isoform x1 [Limosa lapponica baueri]|uniref:Zinc finger protein glis1 isoform x1 n=1 Tax=Limosa lapponica baueri TaxID=1758121 RepID=A0A2I0U2A3_LIMLA|nr:zinc finger protein glis1 isoform x1 [Limosa lapponica baueri]